MSKAPPAREANPDQAVARLRHATRRILQATAWARAVNEVWRTFNRHEARQGVADGPASPAAHVYERATLDAQIMMIARVFDEPGRGHILVQNRMSFPVCRIMLELPGVMDSLLAESEQWNDQGLQNRDVVTARYTAFCEGLDALGVEEPNRVQLVRGFRNENIAHELRFEVLPPRPQYDHIHGLIDEASILTAHLMMVANGSAVHWQDQHIGRSTTWLWDAVAAAPHNLED